MDHQARYRALVEFLLPYQDIWRNEIMLQYPQPLAAFDPAWLAELAAWTTPPKTLALLQGEGWQELSPSLAEFHQRLLELSTFPRPTAGVGFTPTANTWVRIIPKKQHEIERLAPLIARLAQQRGVSRLVDIGGGLGHLAQTLAHHYGLQVTSLDMDAELQESGARWQRLKWPDSPHAVRFVNHQIMRHDQRFAGLMDTDSLTTGLHTCGPLALAHLEAALTSGALLVNLPCCYHKLTPEDCNLSASAHAQPLPWGQFALTLAAGAHRKVALADVAFRNQVKRFRYALHFLLHDEFSRGEQVTLGNCPPELYDGSFADYARAQLARLGLASKLSDVGLNAYQADGARQALMERMLAAGIVREVMGRALESALLVDRALWLEEQGRHVQIQEVFTPQVSPRNLAMIVS